MSMDLQPSTEPAAKTPKVSLLTYATAVPYLQTLLSSQGPIESQEEMSRRLRANAVDTKALEAAGALQPGETYIGVRLIDTNIKQALPPLLSYLKNSPRMATFSPGDNTYLDQEFTRVIQYDGWEIPFVRTLDSAEQNGMGYTVIRHNETKLGHVEFDYSGYQDTIYDRRLDDIQDSPVVMLRHRVSRVTFFEWDSFEGFNKQSMAYQAIEKELFSQTQTQPEVFIYEIFIKEDGFVHRGWYYNAGSDWLLEPSKFSNGVEELVPQVAIPTPENPAMNGAAPETLKPSPRVEYPIVTKYFTYMSNMRNEYMRGRAESDYHKQEAASLLYTALVNGSLQASQTMWSPSGKDVEGGAPKQLNYKIKKNQIWASPMEAFHAPYPDPALGRSIDQIIQQNATETNSVAWAVNNRKDTRKTAAEIKAAEGQQNQLTSTDALWFSMYLRKVFSLAWPIIRSAARAGKIQFMPDMDPAERDAVLAKVYEIKPAGDIDFVEKQARLTNLQQDIPMFAGTPLATQLQLEYIRLRYPEKFAAWSKLLAQNDQAKQLIQGLGAALQEAVTTPDGKLKPEFQPEAQNLKMLQQNVQQFLQPPAPAKS